MRDGVKLFTSIYTPNDASKTNKYPIMMQRTCYSIAPYGETKYPGSLGPSKYIMQEGYIFVYQDVRGRYKSEGTWTNMTPVIDNKKSKTDVDEGSDTYDTIDWLIKNAPNNNGKVGQWGISYPGFYTAAGILSNHPALKASSPQAPISDFFFDDFHHNGAFYKATFLPSRYLVYKKPIQPAKHGTKTMFNPNTKDGYQFLLDLGPLKMPTNITKTTFFGRKPSTTLIMMNFGKNVVCLKHYNKVKPAVMLVGGWFDAEDLTGPLAIYKTIEKKPILTLITPL
jgi:putative CocE/NonD family hydrolase